MNALCAIVNRISGTVESKKPQTICGCLFQTLITGILVKIFLLFWKLTQNLKISRLDIYFKTKITEISLISVHLNRWIYYENLLFHLRNTLWGFEINCQGAKSIRKIAFDTFGYWIDLDSNPGLQHGRTQCQPLGSCDKHCTNE